MAKWTVLIRDALFCKGKDILIAIATLQKHTNLGIPRRLRKLSLSPIRSRRSFWDRTRPLPSLARSRARGFGRSFCHTRNVFRTSNLRKIDAGPIANVLGMGRENSRY
jgi:hypothetical protein